MKVSAAPGSLTVLVRLIAVPSGLLAGAPLMVGVGIDVGDGYEGRVLAGVKVLVADLALNCTDAVVVGRAAAVLSLLNAP